MNFRQKALGAVCAACVAVSGFVFSQRSLDNLADTHPDLQILASCALEKSLVDFVVVDGMRSDAEHKKNLENGVSWTKRSRHQDGMAIDVVAYKDGKVSYSVDLYTEILGAFYFCGMIKNIPIVTGGEWKVGDFMHVELDRRTYP
jgi:hypothetical protein